MATSRDRRRRDAAAGLFISGHAAGSRVALRGVLFPSSYPTGKGHSLLPHPASPLRSIEILKTDAWLHRGSVLLFSQQRFDLFL